MVVKLGSCIVNLTLQVPIFLLRPSEYLLKLVYFLFIKVDVLGSQSEHLLKLSYFSSQSINIIGSIVPILAIKYIF